MNSAMNIERLNRYIDTAWDESIVPALCEYIRIPNKSVHFDPQWEQHGHMERAAELMRGVVRAARAAGHEDRDRAPAGPHAAAVHRSARRRARPLDDDCVLMYGHMDKQPEFTGWAEGLDPWTPVLRDGRLYGRGGADDGYAVFGSLLALRALADQNIPHARCVILIEGSEESGSPDLPAYIDALARSHRRAVAGRVPRCRVRQLRSVLVYDFAARQSRRHAARRGADARACTPAWRAASSPSSFRIARQLLERVEDAATGKF